MADQSPNANEQARDEEGLQDATNDYRNGPDLRGLVRDGVDASAEAAGGNGDGLQNATNPPRAPHQHPTGVPPSVPAVGTLDPRQRDAIELILLGRSDRAVAEAVKVHRVTVTKWRLYDPTFQAALNRRREERWDAAEERVRALLRRAVRVLDRQLRSDDPDVSYRAARALVQMAGAGRFAPGPAPTDPLGVLDLFARVRHVERVSADPLTERLTDRDRTSALRDLRTRRRMLEHQELGTDGGAGGDVGQGEHTRGKPRGGN